MRLFWVFVFTPSLLIFCAFCARVDVKAQSVLLCGLEFHLTRTWPDVGGGCRAFSPVMLFAGQVYEVETAGLFFLCRSDVRVLQEEL